MTSQTIKVSNTICYCALRLVRTCKTGKWYSFTANSQQRHVPYLSLLYISTSGTWWCSWLRHYATSQKVPGLSSNEVDFFNLANPSSRTMTLGLTQSLTEMNTRNVPGGVKSGCRVRLTNLLPSVSRLSRENVGASTSHNPMGLHGLLQEYTISLIR
jgi:hypothetical protein